MSAKVRFYEKRDYSAWGSYLLRSKEATIYHSIEWRDTVRREYGFKDLYLLAESDGRIHGIFPMFLVKNLTGRKMISLPVSMYGGPVADDENVFRLLVESAKDISMRNNAHLRFVSHQDIELTDFSRINNEVDSIISLDFPDLDQMLRSNLPSSSARYTLRKAVRRAQKQGITIAFGGEELLDNYYRLYIETRKSFRLPVPRKTYLKSALANVKGGIAVCYRGGDSVAGALFLEDRDNLYLAVGVSNDDGKKQHAVDLYMWELIMYAYSSNKKKMHLGGSLIENKGLRRFKAKWGGCERNLYEYWFPIGRDYQVKAKREGIPLWDKLPDRAIEATSYYIIKWFY